ncbi:MAG: AI-2E family transporter [Acidimicrobiia bacterium]
MAEPVPANPPEPEQSREAGTLLEVGPAVAIPIAGAVATLLVFVWVMRSVPRALTALAIAALLALALNPIVGTVERRAHLSRAAAAALVLAVLAVLLTIAALLIIPEVIRQARGLSEDIPQTVDSLDDLPFVGDDLRRADAPDKIREWIDELPQRLDSDDIPIERIADTVIDGIAATFLTLLLAITLLLDGNRLANGVLRLVPPAHRPRAERVGDVLYKVLGRYIAGSILVASLAGVVMLISALILGVPLAPLLFAWVTITNLIPQIGGFLGGIVFVALGLTQSLVVALICLAIFLVYQQLENHVLHPLIVGRSVHISPPTSMAVALIGVAAGGFLGALFAVPIVGAAKALYFELRPPPIEGPPEPEPEPEPEPA